MYIPTTAASIMAAAQDQRLYFRTIKNEANASETNEEKEDETFWSHHQTQQPGKDHHPRDPYREERQRETSKNLGERQGNGRGQTLVKQPEWQRGGICGALSSTSQQLNIEPSEQREINDGQTMDNSRINASSREFTVSSIGCAYRAELILGR